MKPPPVTNPALIVVSAYAAARGVTLRAASSYLMAWAVIVTASRVSASALGLQFMPDGSASLDTVAVLFMLLPAAILGRCLTSQAPTLEATRSRRRQPAQFLWVGAIAVIAAVSPLAAAPLLHRSIDPAAFQHAWFIIVGSWLILISLVSPLWTTTSTFLLLAVFSTPGLVPWSANLLYNLEIKDTAAFTGAALCLAGALLSAINNTSAYIKGNE